jgi:hypothetical protein
LIVALIESSWELSEEAFNLRSKIALVADAGDYFKPVFDLYLGCLEIW